MLNYCKILILSLFSGLFAALPVSYSAHFAYLNTVMSFEDNVDQLGFYFSLISAVFALTTVFMLRRIYAKAVRVSLSSSAKLNNPALKPVCRSMLLGLLISLLPAGLMFVPLPNGKLAMDVLVSLLHKDYQLVAACCCVGSGLFLFIAVWYTSQHYERTHRSAKPTAVLRFAIYQLPSYLFPGISHTATGSTALLLTDIDQNVIVREVLLYLAPPMLVVNVARVVRYILAGVTPQPVQTAIAVVGTFASTVFVLRMISRFNLRKSYMFFAVYSIAFGLLITVTSFLLSS